MMENEQDKTFQYSYSAQQQEEIRQIRRKYQPTEQDKMEQLRRLDASATRKGTIVSIVAGSIGGLVFGVGLSCILAFSSTWFVPGILIGTVGLLGMAAALPLYVHITKKERARLAPEILRLTDELMK